MTRSTVLIVAALIAAPAGAAEHTVKMLNKGAAGTMVFEPAFLQVKPGDTVRFLPTDKSHNAESIAAMLPTGATPFRGKMNQEVVATFDKPGLYGIKCAPHYGMGMVALVQVGKKPANLAEAQAASHPGLAKKRMGELLTKVAK